MKNEFYHSIYFLYCVGVCVFTILLNETMPSIFVTRAVFFFQFAIVDLFLV